MSIWRHATDGSPCESTVHRIPGGELGQRDRHAFVCDEHQMGVETAPRPAEEQPLTMPAVQLKQVGWYCAGDSHPGGPHEPTLELENMCRSHAVPAYVVVLA